MDVLSVKFSGSNWIKARHHTVMGGKWKGAFNLINSKLHVMENILATAINMLLDKASRQAAMPSY